jgi:hypothetical protein
LLDRHRPVDLDQQDGQDTPLPCVPELNRPATDIGLDVAEQPN